MNDPLNFFAFAVGTTNFYSQVKRNSRSAHCTVQCGIILWATIREKIIQEYFSTQIIFAVVELTPGFHLATQAEA